MGALSAFFLFFVFIALIPVIVISIIIIFRDKEREPVKTLVKYFALGILSVIIANVLYMFVFFEPNPDDMYMIVFITTFFGVAVIEELSKWISVKIGMVKDLEYNNMYDGILFAMIVSLGFAGVENILYVFDSMESFATFYIVAAGRAFLAVPGHAIDGLFMGLFLEKAKVSKINDDQFGNIVYQGLSLFVPMILHTVYDSILIYCSGSHMAGLSVFMFIVFVLYTITIYVVAIIFLIKTSNKSGITFESMRKKKIPLISFCSNCGTRIDGSKFCSNCGNRLL